MSIAWRGLQRGMISALSTAPVLTSTALFTVTCIIEAVLEYGHAQGHIVNGHLREEVDWKWYQPETAVRESP